MKYVYSVFAHARVCISPQTQILTGTTPFSNESDEEIINRVAAGIRPEWPSNNPPQGLADALWEQIKACWKQDPKERPTASNVLETLLALDGGAYHREPSVSMGDPDDEATIAEWEHVEDGPEEGTFFGLGVTPGLTLFRFTVISAHKKRKAYHKEHQNSSGLSGSTIVSSFRSHMRSFLHLPRHATELVGKREPVEKPRPGIEIIDRREENVTVRDDRVAYFVSGPIPEGKTLRKVVITVISKDQGWSSYHADHGSYRNSWTWFELSVGPSKDSERWCGEVVRNLHAHDKFKEHTVEIVDGELYKKAKSGDVLTVWALARYSGWKNTVKKVTIRYVVD